MPVLYAYLIRIAIKLKFTLQQQGGDDNSEQTQYSAIDNIFITKGGEG